MWPPNFHLISNFNLTITTLLAACLYSEHGAQVETAHTPGEFLRAPVTPGLLPPSPAGPCTPWPPGVPLQPLLGPPQRQHRAAAQDPPGGHPSSHSIVTILFLPIFLSVFFSFFFQ